ncbi:MAG: hypothetical protein L7U72_06735 [Rubripirellula sp.]|nr:hypothetical protein [Rubripirellula sp.]
MMKSRPFHLYLYGRDRDPINTSFDAARLRMEQLPSLCFELDGSFAWMREPGTDEIYGIIYDASHQLQYVDLHGFCTKETFLQLCSAIIGREGEECGDFEILLLPERKLQEFQDFVATWSDE